MKTTVSNVLMVEVTGIEPATSWSQTTRATNCATPGYRCAPERRGAKPAAAAELQMLGYYSASLQVCQSEIPKYPISAAKCLRYDSQYGWHSMGAPAKDKDYIAVCKKFFQKIVFLVI